MFSIKNEILQITVKKTGAELCSMKSLKSNHEYIWNADPKVWASHAPNLFPIIGCLKDGGFLYNNKEYHCPKHGFIRNNKEIVLVEQTKKSLTFGLKFNPTYLKIYPFQFEFLIRYELLNNKLVVSHTIKNHGNDDMLFSLGAHPGFTCPMHANEVFEDYYLEFENNENSKTWKLDSNGLLTGESQPVFNNSDKIELHSNLFNEDALIFKDLTSSKVNLKSKRSKQVLTMEFKDFPYLGIWAKPNSKYVCIEPWLGIADSVNSNRQFINKEGLLKLKSKKVFQASYSISIKE